MTNVFGLTLYEGEGAMIVLGGDRGRGGNPNTSMGIILKLHRI
jgi:hypothetical protein